MIVAVVDSGEKWGINMFMGEFHHNLDEKNRLTLPSKFREELADCVMTRGLEECILVYPESSWMKIMKHINTLPFTKKDARSFMRFFLSGATKTEFDKQGRINITSPLISYANIKKECVIVGVGDHIEIWDQELWEKNYNMNKSMVSDIAEDLFETLWTEGE